jgi:hypothetical protein
MTDRLEAWLDRKPSRSQWILCSTVSSLAVLLTIGDFGISIRLFLGLLLLWLPFRFIWTKILDLPLEEKSTEKPP